VVVRRYSLHERRSLIAMTARARHRMNSQAGAILVKPFVVLAARVLGPGPMRLKMVKLAHNLDHSGVVIEPAGGFGEELGPVTQPTSRAA
jgi:hypothetical protein